MLLLLLPALRKALHLELLFLLQLVCCGDMDGHFEDPYFQVFILFFVITVLVPGYL